MCGRFTLRSSGKAIAEVGLAELHVQPHFNIAPSQAVSSQLEEQPMRLFIDDLRTPPSEGFIVARSSVEAIAAVQQHGWPTFISFDHDLGGEDTTMVFLRILVKMRENQPIPDYRIHSANPVGSENIRSFMESWKRSVTLE